VISSQAVVVASKEQVFSDLGGEAVVLSLKSGVYYGLDEVGAHIWDLIQTPRRVSEVCDLLLEEYDVEPDNCEHDVIALLLSLASEGLIEICDATCDQADPASAA
jgi:hypothetical protein